MLWALLYLSRQARNPVANAAGDTDNAKFCSNMQNRHQLPVFVPDSQSHSVFGVEYYRGQEDTAIDEPSRRKFVRMDFEESRIP